MSPMQPPPSPVRCVRVANSFAAMCQKQRKLTDRDASEQAAPQAVQMWLSARFLYMFSYNMFQFCGHTWILANMAARFLMFGRDSLADTFYSIGVVMTLCQLLTVLEPFHIADGIDNSWLLPRLFQVVERNLLLLTIVLTEEIQSKPVVCVQFFLWNVLDLLRYPQELLRVMGYKSPGMLWSYTLSVPLYLLAAATEGLTMYQALDPLAKAGEGQVLLPISSPNRVPVFLKSYLLVLAVGAAATAWQLVKERRHQLDKWDRKSKLKKSSD